MTDRTNRKIFLAALCHSITANFQPAQLSGKRIRFGHYGIDYPITDVVLENIPEAYRYYVKTFTAPPVYSLLYELVETIVKKWPFYVHYRNCVIRFSASANTKGTIIEDAGLYLKTEWAYQPDDKRYMLCNEVRLYDSSRASPMYGRSTLSYDDEALVSMKFDPRATSIPEDAWMNFCQKTIDVFKSNKSVQAYDDSKNREMLFAKLPRYLTTVNMYLPMHIRTELDFNTVGTKYSCVAEMLNELVSQQQKFLDLHEKYGASPEIIEAHREKSETRHNVKYSDVVLPAPIRRRNSF